MRPASLFTPKPLDLLVQWPASLSSASFVSGLDNETRTVRVTGGGIWRRADADRYFEQQRYIVDEARRRFGALRVSFDVRGWIVENPDSALQFQGMNAEIYRPEDRLVALVSCSALKPHPRTALGPGSQVFISDHAAETWLQAFAAND